LDDTLVTDVGSPDSAAIPRMTHDQPTGPMPLPPGESVGRYVILQRIGEGGMGVVYAAYDPELDRKVAVKLLLEDKGDEGARRRLKMEARALAKLNHPNVITVHDVGSFQGHVFIAMEIIDGWNANGWAKEVEPSWRELLEVYVKAGHGLAAAHGAGIIHRDFKPDNILVGRSGRVRVTDFGISRVQKLGLESSVDALALFTSQVRDVASDNMELFTSSDGRLTAPGAVPGTAGFIAPEQYEGIDADAASDQFSFCVSLYEGLYGERPFAGNTHASIAFAIIQGRVREAPRDTKVPAWVRRVILRGLSKDPSDRYPSMEALLAELQFKPDVRRNQMIAASGAIVALLAGGYAAFGVQTPDPCPAPTEKFVGLWDGPTQATIKERFLATEAPFALDSYTSVNEGLTAYASAWSDLHSEVCRATRVRGEQSEAALDLRMACLEGRRDELRATIDVLSHADLKVVQEQAIDAARSLPTLDRCSDIDALRADVPPPEDPAAREEAARIRATLPAVRSAKLAGEYTKALEAASVAVRDASALGFDPLIAETEFLLANLQRETDDHAAAESTMRSVIQRSAKTRDTKLAAEAWAELIFIVSRLRPNDAVALELAGDAAVLAAGDPPLLRAKLLSKLAAAATIAKDHVRGRQWANEGIDIYRREELPDDRELASLHVNLGAAWYYAGDHEKTRQSWKRGMEIFEEALGSSHPMVASVATNMILVADTEEGLALALRALPILEASRGKTHSHVGANLLNISKLYLRLDRFEEAEAAARRALPIYEASYGAEGEKTFLPLQNLTEALLGLERIEEAAKFAERAATTAGKHENASHQVVASVLKARSHFELGQRAEAIKALEATKNLAAELTKSTDAANHAEWMARVLLEEDPKKARAHAETALQRLEVLDEKERAQELRRWIADAFGA
jgi:tetratricopeptide (TPR) repeat protein